jgi:hypothetical protein
VTRCPPDLARSNGTPFRVAFTVAGGCNALRASCEITSPTVFLCVAASSFAAASTSSSMESVVLKPYPSENQLYHQASRIKHHNQRNDYIEANKCGHLFKAG